MPKEIKTREEFEKLLPSAIEIRIVRPRGLAEEGEEKGEKGGKEEEKEEADVEVPPTKIKIRTAKSLYTFKTTEDDVESLVKGTKTPVVEF